MRRRSIIELVFAHDGGDIRRCGATTASGRPCKNLIRTPPRTRCRLHPLDKDDALVYAPANERRNRDH